MRKICIQVFFVLFSFVGFAQHKGNTQSHTIKKGETISTLAKLYKVSTHDILTANGLTDKTILKIGQIVIIPKSQNIKVETKPTVVATLNTAKPKSNQHLIVGGDNLSKIAKKYNVTEKELMQWNGLSNSNIKAGTLLYISKPDGSKSSNTVISDIKKNEEKKEAPKPVVEEKKEVKPIIVDIEPAKENKKSEPKPIVNTTIKDVNPDTLGKGTFEKDYSSTSNSVEGICAVFKTIAGWHDTKYYILINNAESGTIVKVIANNKFVYAKVLGPLPDIKEDKNCVMRVSNAAAAALGITDTKFLAKVEF